ncbi:MAG: energy-coupling factor transporter ATPase [Candidatus Bathyarchaeia archaeon]
MSKIIKIENLTYTYPRGITALKNLNLEVEKGEFLVIMGPNGAGKTTLCLTLNGIIPNSLGGEMAGRVSVCGMDTLEHRVYELAQKVGMIVQNPEAQLFMPDVISEVAFALENLEIPREDIIKRIEWALKITRLEGLEHRSPFELSGGQKQRVGIAAALAMKPEILVLDEPTSQLDPMGTSEVFSTVKELNEELGITIVMAEHKSEEVAEVADRILVLNEGEIIAEEEPRKIFEKKELLDKIYVKLPQVTELFHLLKRNGISLGIVPISLTEAYQELSKLLKSQGEAPSKPLEKLRAPSRALPAIETKDLWYVYPGNVLALKSINIKIYDGEFVGIVGQNGAGKTTLVKHFIGLLKPTKGKVLVEGVGTERLSVAELSRKVGLVLQNPDHQIFASSVESEVAFGPKNLKLSKDKVEERVGEALKLTGLEEYKNAHPLSLSWGDRQKVAVASILAMRPKILIFDEPTTGQDYLGRRQVMDLAKGLNEKGHTIIAISHDMELIAEYSKRTIVMGVGEVLLDGPTEYVFSNPEILEKTYLKPPQVTQLASRLTKYGIPRGVLTVDEMYHCIKKSI